jgi:hypothetical protein
MERLTKEADRLRSALIQTPPGPHYDRLYVAQQAIVWAGDPETFKAPYDLIIGTRGGLEDCPAGNDHSRFLDTPDHRAS